jgi:hypothetical protein
MAKHCDVCNQSYPETESHCPHCAAAGKASEQSPRAPDATERRGDSGSAVNLSEPYVAEVADSSGRLSGPPGPAGTSDTAWAALVEDVSDEAAKVDSPSDADLLAHAADTPPPASPARLAGEPAAAGEPFVAEPASDVNLAPPAKVDTPPPAASRAAGGEPFVAEADDDESSAIDLAALAAQPPSGSNLLGSEKVRPGAEAPATEPEAGADARRADEEGLHFLDEVTQVEAGSAVNLGEAVRPTDRPSSRDLIAEAVESGIDVGSGPLSGESATEKDAARLAGSESDIDLQAAAAKEVPSSGPEAVRERGTRPDSRSDIDIDDVESSDRVDLGGSHEPAEEAANVPPAPSSEVDLAGRGGRARRRAVSEPASDVDLAGAAADSQARLARQEAEEAAEPEEEAAAEAPEEDERPAPKPAKVRSGGGRALVGGGVGLLIGLVVAFGLWLFGVEPPAGWKLAGESKGPANAGRQQALGQNPAPGAGAPTAADPGEFLKRGDFAKAVESFKSAPETPETQTQRGTARWLAYLQEQKTKSAALNANDEAVKQARTDLEAAAQKDNAEALLALGSLQEWTGTPADAAKTYQDGLKRFAGNARWVRVFQAQLNRLEAVPAAPVGGGKPGADARHPGANAAEALVALLLALQAGQPDQGGQPAAEDDEAGFEFWAAVKSAHAGDYGAALQSLESARKAHDKLRFTRLRKAQNPLSDPTEEIFLRSVKEIEAYWSLQNYLMQQKLMAKGGDPVKAVEGAVKNASDLQGQLKTANDQLAAEKGKVGQKEAELSKSLATAKKDAEAARKEAKDAEDKAAQAGEQFNSAEGKLKGVGDRLQAAGVKEPDPAKGVDALAAERDAADKTLGAVADKLAGANIRVGKKDVVQGVERVVQAARQRAPDGTTPPPPPLRPVAQDVANPLLAEAHYAAGLRAYFAGRFGDAESAFIGAVEADNQDARYFYFLGLTRLALNKVNEANTDFEEGARLERDNRPARKVVSTALERIQGPPRQVLNRFRP